jgi:hypothetical protein
MDYSNGLDCAKEDRRTELRSGNVKRYGINYIKQGLRGKCKVLV